MSAKFQDYYQSLGVSRTATADEIQQAYRKLARQYHPDVNKEPAAEARFKQINEAYEVLKDVDKRKRYDALGENWKQGQDFRPPPGWTGNGRGGGGGFRVDFGGQGRGGGGGHADFSEFFESIFGGMGGAGGMGGMGGGGMGDLENEEFVEAMRSRGRGGRARAQSKPRTRQGDTQEAEITISISDAFHGGTRRITLTTMSETGEESSRSYDMRIPPGVTDGSVIRLTGQGAPGIAGGPPGDLLLRINLAPDARFKLDPDRKHDLITTLSVSPWEAALGAKVPVPTPDGEITMTLPPGTQSGQRMRIKGRGLPMKAGEAGDLYAEIRITVPKSLSDAERQAYEALRDASPSTRPG